MSPTNPRPSAVPRVGTGTSSFGGYPRVERYLALLPRGLESYPEAQCIARAYACMLPQSQPLAEDPHLPAPVRRCLEGRFPGEWIGEVMGNVLMLLIREQRFTADAPFFDWYRATIIRPLFETPAIRLLMHVLSPTLAVMGAAKRWSAMHRGTELVLGKVTEAQGQRQARLTLRTPAHLFGDPLLASRLGVAYRMALDAARARETDVRTSSPDPQSVVFDLSWVA
jgi:hypothetical protein